MTLRRFCRASLLALLPFLLLLVAHAQGAKKTTAENRVADAAADPKQPRSEWFLRGRVAPGKSSAELRRRAYQVKMQARGARLVRGMSANLQSSSSGTWTPLGPVPLASDAT